MGEIDGEMIRQLRHAWRKEQSALWREFKGSLTPSQLALYKAHRRATAMIAKLRRWEKVLEQGLPLRARGITWPEDHHA